MPSPAVRSVNKSRGTHNCIWNEPQYLCRFHRSLKLPCHEFFFLWPDMENNPYLQSSWWWPPWRVITRWQCWHGQWPWWQPVKIPELCDGLLGRNCFAFCKTYREWKGVMGFALWCCLSTKLNFDFELHFWWVSSYISIRLGRLRWVPTVHCTGRRGLNLLTVVRPVELAQYAGAKPRGSSDKWLPYT